MTKAVDLSYRFKPGDIVEFIKPVQGSPTGSGVVVEVEFRLSWFADHEVQYIQYLVGFNRDSAMHYYEDWCLETQLKVVQ
jgi:hypothetical protein